jgi:hypothetical protein
MSSGKKDLFRQIAQPTPAYVKPSFLFGNIHREPGKITRKKHIHLCPLTLIEQTWGFAFGKSFSKHPLKAERNTPYQLEVPNKLGIRERRNKSTGGSVDMDIHRQPLLLVLFTKKVIYFLDIFVLTSIGCPQNGADQNGIFVDCFQ